MNTVSKGNKMERLLLLELTEYIKESGAVILASWKTNRSHFSANDFYGGWDCAILSEKNYNMTQWLVQVKSVFSTKELERLKKLAYGNCYLAVYNEPRSYSIKLKHFWLVLV